MRHNTFFSQPPGYLCDQCREGATFANAAISANLQNTHLIRIPNARTMSECAIACCNHSGCDLAWLLGRQCYIVDCQHKESCEPQKFEHMQSYLTFVLRPSPRFISLPLYDNFVPNGKYLLGDQSDPEEDMASLKDLSSLIKNPGLEELADYTDDYGAPQLDLLHPNLNEADKLKPDLDFISWLMPDAVRNSTAVEVGRRNDDDAENPKQDSIVSNVVLGNVSEILSGDQLTTAIAKADTVLPRGRETNEEVSYFQFFQIHYLFVSLQTMGICSEYKNKILQKLRQGRYLGKFKYPTLYHVCCWSYYKKLIKVAIRSVQVHVFTE